MQGLLKAKGWRRRGLAALLGIFAAAALPPFYALPLLIPAFSGLFLLVHYAAGRRQAFFDGWWWGFGYFTAGLYWICISLWVDPEHYAWLTPFALFGLPSILAFYIALVTWLLYWLSARIRVTGSHKVVLFAALWVIVEYLRAIFFTGFPWNLIGYVWTVSEATLQFASVAGIYGLSWITVLVAAMPALWVLKESTGYAKKANLYTAFLLVAITVFGLWRLETHPTVYTSTKVRIVQANVPQRLKWDPKELIDGLRKNVRLTRLEGLDSVQLVLWPETAVPYYIEHEKRLAEDLGSILPPHALLLTGALRGNAAHDSWNSVYVLDGSGRIRAQYDKHHLVPFGEYIPLRWLLPVNAIAADMGDFMSGPGPRTLDIAPYPPLSPLVCYEAIFPGEATDGAHSAKWLFSLTDDAWFGYSTSAFQDVQMARTRAVEEGLPLLRAANTGISAGIDAYGRILGSLPLEKEGVLDLYLPKEDRQESIFSRFPQGWILVVIAGSLVFIRLFHKKHTASL